MADMKSVLLQAAEALRDVIGWVPGPAAWPTGAPEKSVEKARTAIAALEAAIGEQQEPVAWLVSGGRMYVRRAFVSESRAEQAVAERKDGSSMVPLYASPPLPLKDEGEARDAARYRWLRDCGKYFAYEGPSRESPWAVIGINHTDCYPCSGAQLDEAIDAALSAKDKP